MKTYLKKDKGITLVALVITIIILLILAGVAIASLTNKGLFDKTKIAKQNTLEGILKENIILNEYENELNEYTGEKSKIEGKLVDRVNDGTIKIGDYVSYNPEDLDNTLLENLKSNLNIFSGINRSTINSTIKRDELKWRVFDVTENGQVRLISASSTDSKIELKGFNGYNNAVKLIDDVCSVLYDNKDLASKVQNLKIEDIQNKMKTDYTKINNNYNKVFEPKNKYYPSILLKEREQTVTIDKTPITGTELDLSEQKELINQTTSQQVKAWKVKYTYWNKAILPNDFKDNNNKYYELLIGKDSNSYYPEYWMSSRCMGNNSNYAYFRVRYVSSGNIDASSLYGSSGSYEPNCIYAFRPVITLKSDVQIDVTNSGDGSLEEKAYAIK